MTLTSESSPSLAVQHSAMSRVCSLLDNGVEARSVLDMRTDLECEDCGRSGNPDTFEIHNYIGARRKKYPLPRCIDRKECEFRVMLQTAEAHAEISDEVAEAARTIHLLRQDVKDAEKELARQIKYALKEGVAVAQIAMAAGISRERVYQIRDGRR